MRKDLVLIEIPLPQVTEHDDQALHSEASHPGVMALSSNVAEKEEAKCAKEAGSLRIRVNLLKEQYAKKCAPACVAREMRRSMPAMVASEYNATAAALRRHLEVVVAHTNQQLYLGEKEFSREMVLAWTKHGI